MPTTPLLVRGMSASPGVVTGPAFVIERRRAPVLKVQLPPQEIDAEVDRLKVAIESSHEQVQTLRGKLGDQHGEPSQILEAQAMLLRDEQLVEEPVRLIREKLINAEWAVVKVLKALRKIFDMAQDAYLRERGSDIDHVGERVLQNLTGGKELKISAPRGAVVVAKELSPADVVQLHRAGVAALATDVGGRTSHTALMARSFDLPAVVGLKDLSTHVENGDEVVVDGLSGEVVVLPTATQRRLYALRASEFVASEEALLQDRDKPAVTQDGYVVRLMANIELAEEVGFALRHGAEGVGLYRTEFLYMNRDALPTEQEHDQDARTILAGMGSRPVTFRTFDLGGGDKTSPLIDWPKEENPALGLRSIRLALREPDMFRCQLRGLLRAAAVADQGQMKLMFPMVSSVQELRVARQILEDCREDLAQQGHLVPEELEVGIMVEMPAAAIIADLLARECDFFSIGSNDLIQYSLAMDRDNELVNYLYHPLHPAILRVIRSVTRVAHTQGIRVTLCGEMAAEPAYAMALVGLGLDELSMPAGAIPRIKRIIRACSQSDALELAEELVILPTVDAIEDRVREAMCPQFVEDLGALRRRPEVPDVDGVVRDGEPEGPACRDREDGEDRRPPEPDSEPGS